MKSATLYGLLTILALGTTDYVGKYENFDVDGLFSDKNNVLLLVKCVLGETPCPPETEDLKNTFLEQVQDKCSKCSPNIKELYKKGFAYFKESEPDLWERVTTEFDLRNKFSFLF